MTANNVNHWSAKQRKLMEWLTTDPYMRIPPTQQMLASDLGVREETLSRWKSKPGFWDEVNGIARQYLSHHISEVFSAVVREAVKGSFPHQKLFLEVVGEIDLDAQANNVQIIIERAANSTAPAHLSPSSTNGHRPAAPVQRPGVWPEVGENDNGPRPSD